MPAPSGEECLANRRGRLDDGDGRAQQGRGIGVGGGDVLPFRVCGERGFVRALVVGRQGVQRVPRRQLRELVPIHAFTPISTRSRDRPSRILVLTVPSGDPVIAAISL